MYGRKHPPSHSLVQVNLSGVPTSSQDSLQEATSHMVSCLPALQQVLTALRLWIFFLLVRSVGRSRNPFTPRMHTSIQVLLGDSKAVRMRDGVVVVLPMGSPSEENHPVLDLTQWLCPSSLPRERRFVLSPFSLHTLTPKHSQVQEYAPCVCRALFTHSCSCLPSSELQSSATCCPRSCTRTCTRLRGVRALC